MRIVSDILNYWSIKNKIHYGPYFSESGFKNSAIKCFYITGDIFIKKTC